MNQKPTAVALLLLAAMATVARSQEASATGVARSAAPVLPQGPRSNGATTLAQAWTMALSTMRAHKAPGLVFVLPPAEARADAAAVAAAKGRFRAKMMDGAPVDAKNARELMLLHVQLLRQERAVAPAAGDAPIDLCAMFGLAVPVVATAAAAGAEAGETLVLLAEDGKRAAGAKVDLADPQAVAAAVRPWLFADAKLTPRRANVTPSVTAAARDLDELRKRLAEEQDGDRQQALLQRQQAILAKLQEQLFAAAPALYVTPGEGAVDGRAEGRGRVDARDLLAELLQWTTPLGTEVAATWDPCPPCGMMAMPMPFRSALKLLAQ